MVLSFIVPVSVFLVGMKYLFVTAHNALPFRIIIKYQEYTRGWTVKAQRMHARWIGHGVKINCVTQRFRDFSPLLGHH